MKITDISSAPEAKEEDRGVVENDADDDRRSKNTLLRRYDIPVEQLDFGYVKKCTDVQKIERILRVLRSGEEGTFPELQQCVEKRLEKLCPNSRLLHLETAAIRTKELDREEQDAVQNGLEQWLNFVTQQSSSYSKQDKSKDIFSSEGASKGNGGEINDILNNCPLPVRGSAGAHMVQQDIGKDTPVTDKNKNENGSTRIKSWEYDKWNKYDVDAELTKLDITDMQREEWEKREKPKIIEEQRKIKKLMKPANEVEPSLVLPKSTNRSSKSSSEKPSPKPSQKMPISPSSTPAPRKCLQKNSRLDTTMSVENPSYIEEVIDSDDDEAGIKVNTSAVFPSRRPRLTTVTIEDLNLAM